MKKFFWLEQSPSRENKYIIKMNFDELPLVKTTGSYAILPARLLGLNYADYLRLCRDEFGADIMGKKSLYPIAYFKKDEKVDMLVKILNKRTELIMAAKKGVSKEYEEEFQQEHEEIFGVTLNGDIFIEKE